MDSPDVTEVRCWIYCLALFLRVFNYSWEDEPPAAPVVRVWAETEGWQEEGGTLLRFLLQSLEKVKGKFSSVQLQCRLENRRSLCDVRQNQQQVFLTGQIRGSTVMACCRPFLAECSFLGSLLCGKHLYFQHNNNSWALIRLTMNNEFVSRMFWDYASSVQQLIHSSLKCMYSYCK